MEATDSSDGIESPGTPGRESDLETAMGSPKVKGDGTWDGVAMVESVGKPSPGGGVEQPPPGIVVDGVDGERRVGRERKLKKSKYDGIDYDVTASLEALRARQRKVEQYTGHVCLPFRTLAARQMLLRWVLALTAAGLTACVSYGLTIGVKYIHEAKIELVQDQIKTTSLFAGYLVSLIFWLSLTAIATSLTYWAPMAAGSGIPQVKGFLNGVNMREMFTMKTFVAKIVGIIACLGIGFPAGRQGPMVQIGATIGAGLCRGYSKMLCGVGAGERLRLYNSMDTPEVRRDFVSLGSACGVAAAFAAPMGGILFAVEEVSSYWSPSLTFQAFGAACVSAYVVSALVSGAEISDEGWVLFGTDDDHSYKAWEVIPFSMVSVGGALIGTTYNSVNTRILAVRKAHIKGHKNRQVMEAFFLITTVMTILYWIPAWYSCTPSKALVDHEFAKTGIYIENYTCPEGQFSQMATLTHSPQERIILQLYSRNTPGYFDPEILFVFVIVYFLMSSITFGIAVPSGLFIPSTIIGAAWGRLCGECIYKEFPDTDPGVYALVGAASALGGITRMTLSLAAILVELTNDIDTLLPIMLALTISKTIGDCFNESIYASVLHSMGVILIPSELPSSIEMQTVRDVMSPDPEALPKVAKVGAINYALELPYNCFPVVAGDGPVPMLFCGLVTRAQLESAMCSVFAGDPAYGNVSLDTRIPIDLRNYMTISPLIILDTSPLRHAYRLFRAMGLRHLPVVNSHHEVVGIVTRTDLSVHEVPVTTTLTTQHHDYPVVYSMTEEALRQNRNNSTFSLVNRKSSVALPPDTFPDGDLA